METIIFQILGLLSFLISTVILALLLRRNPSKEMAEKTSKISHFFYYFGLMLPGGIGFFYPGLTHFDAIIGFTPLPLRPIALAIGVVLLVTGLYLTLFSVRAIKALGEGAPAFKLSKKIVQSDLYKVVRNPMSLGWYLACFGVSLAAGSTYLFVASILLTAVHAFNLKYFEELELELRYGETYLAYKASTPFLIPGIKSTVSSRES